ncbi:hypothetical protein NDU88_001119 [Pleurodeles waltl]|uniref:Uncharacterized protein n=1 Tax=Pleurodeles waltl TaxID=8319 RepID=A0AAV7NI31_PLEWA|nr:hypothetical protein NDU88_001119 [Pleurodeles waltl]
MTGWREVAGAPSERAAAHERGCRAGHLPAAGVEGWLRAPHLAVKAGEGGHDKQNRVAQLTRDREGGGRAGPPADRPLKASRQGKNYGGRGDESGNPTAITGDADSPPHGGRRNNVRIVGLPEGDINEEFQSYYTSLYGAPEGVDPDSHPVGIQLVTVSEWDGKKLGARMEEQEVGIAISAQATGKTLGTDGLPPDIPDDRAIHRGF